MTYTVAMATAQTHLQTSDEVTWGDRLRRIRLNRHMDQRHFAAAIGVAKPTVGKYEMLGIVPRNHRLVENSVELRFGPQAAAFLRGTLEPTVLGVRHLRAVAA